ncbi:1-acyl-sn-glycerol-3-phosphate acyltransferase [candidate division KSB3 bacterium]|uniref:1-acyl-sn-glycerol-3-phosphate acyltransferase n=1 Tax=candidate division KSB3 bacterium TaxID=2044937 RepID=A0A2G6K7G1_9BACT|nr:MAG: 1-acyl-sn-glycerol-3-phosphate acyltransferase [candidate division KSB3 bacterium]
MNRLDVQQPHSFSRFDKRYYLPARPYGFALFRLYFRLKVSGVEHVPKTGPVILVPNHTSFMDPPLLSSAVPRVLYFLMLHHHFYHRYFYWLFRRLPCIPVKRGNMASTSALKLCLQVLRHNQILCMFPEGGISREHKARGTRTGAAVLALKTGAPIVPAGIIGASNAFPLHSRFPRPKPISIKFGDPMNIPAGDVRDKELLQSIMTDTMSRIRTLTEEPSSITN